MNINFITTISSIFIDIFIILYAKKKAYEAVKMLSSDRLEDLGNRARLVCAGLKSAEVAIIISFVIGYNKIVEMQLEGVFIFSLFLSVGCHVASREVRQILGKKTETK
ncbi:MAG: hypothetical protein K9M54_11415 [Kiritimatiellales bacterium]|nr:hypothetical protein [Kiritimatiellales bacterium]